MRPAFFARSLLASLAVAGLLAASPTWAQKLMTVQSGSMEPTLHRDSHVWVNLVAMLTSDPVRGDVVVFRPPTGDGWWMSRVIGLPGDSLRYGADHRLTINGHEVDLRASPEAPPATESFRDIALVVRVEALPGSLHRILVPKPGPEAPVRTYRELAQEPACRVSAPAFECQVPPGRYFLMGDNRDNARDSRYLGFIPRESIGGRVSTGDTP